MAETENTGFFAGAKKSSLEDVLCFREEKARRQREILGECSTPLLCVGLNIPGEYKRCFPADCAFVEALRVIRLELAAEGLVVTREEQFEAAGGQAAFIAADGEPENLKALARRIEDSHPLGRLFDIDVLRRDGGKISRRDSGGPGRPCLVCGGDAFICGRSRSHSAVELQNIAANLILRFRREKLLTLTGQAALRALLTEAAVTPKPGLVDRLNSGAHRDMDFFSFINSTAALLPYFQQCAGAGFDAAEQAPEKMMSLPAADRSHPSALFKTLRPAGKAAEIMMRAATAGANTHRGLIFSLGLASAAFGAFFRHQEQICAAKLLDFAASMTIHLTDDFAGELLSHGGAIQRRYGIGGIREEAIQGFPAVRDHALPALHKALASGSGINDAGLAAFLHLLEVVSDTNIIHRSSPERLAEIQNTTGKFLASKPGPHEMIEYATKLDREFIRLNISPGGCADLLALSLFLHFLCEQL